MLTWLFTTAIGRIIGAAAAGILLSSILYAGCQVKGCIQHQAEVKAKTAEKTLEVREQDDELQEEVDEMSDDELADYLRRGGVRD